MKNVLLNFPLGTGLLLACLLIACNSTPKHEAESSAIPVLNNCSPNDKVISKQEAGNWIDNWKTYKNLDNHESDPTSFPDYFEVEMGVVSSFILSEGNTPYAFRIYYGMKQANNRASMRMMLVKANDECSDVLDAGGCNDVLVFHPAGSGAEETMCSDSNFITLATAKNYTQNWRDFYQYTSAEDTTYQIDGTDTTKVIFLAYAFATDTFQTKVVESCSACSTLALYPGIEMQEKNLIYKQILYSCGTQSQPCKDGVNIGGADSYLDFSRPCPQHCGGNGALQ